MRLPLCLRSFQLPWRLVCRDQHGREISTFSFCLPTNLRLDSPIIGSLAGIGAAKQLACDDALEEFQKMAPTGDRP